MWSNNFRQTYCSKASSVWDLGISREEIGIFGIRCEISIFNWILSQVQRYVPMYAIFRHINFEIGILGSYILWNWDLGIPGTPLPVGLYEISERLFGALLWPWDFNQHFDCIFSSIQRYSITKYMDSADLEVIYFSMPGIFNKILQKNTFSGHTFGRDLFLPQ